MAYYDFKSKGSRTAIGQALIERTADKIHRLLSPYLKPGAEVLDIGPGAGEFARRCIAAGCSYSAVEANEEYCRVVRGMGARVVVQGFVPPVPMPDRSFDVVYIAHLLEHMSGPIQALQLVTEARRVLKPGGIVCIVSPDFLYDPLFFFDGDYTHAFPTTENRVRMLLRENGFELRVARTMAGPFTGILGWLAASVNACYSTFLYYPLSRLLRPWVDPVKLGKPRSAFWRCILVLARRPE